MAYEIGWRVERRLIYLRVWDNMPLLEANEAVEKILEALNQGSPPIHMIVDLRELRFSPTGIQANLQLNSYLRHPNLGWLVTVGGTPLTQFIANVVKKFYPIKMHHSDSFDAVLEFLLRKDPSLEALI
jgi:hypothetical protein